MKKYLYTGILLGTIVLAGCSANEVTEEQVPAKEEKVEDVTNGQEVEVETSPDTDKEEVVSVPPLDLTQEQKENYYKEYVTLIELAKSEYHNAVLEIEPIDNFKDEDWVEIEEFEKRVEERANDKFVVSKNSDKYSPVSVPKIAKLYIGSNVTTINFKGSFETQLNSNTPGGRQLFSKFNSISSEIEGNDGSWSQTGHDSLLIDDGISYMIAVGGKYSENGIISFHNIELEFHCDKNGGIS
ncbi:hypothetical protein AB1K83_14200 [Sporosarcina sp. 179-K 3D1 HS]|uniref:hypothetical protein n=1 Tax=Sporosarcina sp. 179-K 3D1 HS TaxID=3232169 RepID=UPI0039A13CE0